MIKMAQKLTEISKAVRRDIIDIACENGLEHIAPAFSTVDMLVTLYELFMKGKDKFILSKGHGCLALYAVLRRHGLNPAISGHPDIECEQGIECTTGSLGHGLPIAAGMAIARKIKREKGHIYVMLGDGECQEGTTWETLLIAAHHGLNNFTVIVDCSFMSSSFYKGDTFDYLRD